MSSRRRRPVRVSALHARAGRFRIGPRTMAVEQAGAAPAACLRTPLGLPVCVDVAVHRPLWRHR